MKKDIFNGKIKQEYIGMLYFSIVAAFLIFLGCAVTFLCIAVLYQNVEYSARIVLFVMAALCFVFAVVFPVSTIVCVRIYPKHRKLTHFLVKQYVLIDEEQSTVSDEQ